MRIVQLLLLLSPLINADGDVTLTFTMIPDQIDEVEQARVAALQAYLTQDLETRCGVNLTLNYFEAVDYPAAVAALGAGDADFGWYGGLTGVQAGLNDEDALYLAQRIEDQQFTSVFIQAPGLSLTNGTQQDVSNYNLAFGAEESTSGHLMPQYYLTQANVTPKSTVFSGNHDATVDLVADVSNNVEVGALNSLVWERRVETNTTGNTTVFYTTPPYVDYLWVAGGGLQEEKKWSSATCPDIYKALRDSFNMASDDNSTGTALLTSFSTTGFVRVNPLDYIPIFETGCAEGLIEEDLCPGGDDDQTSGGKVSATFWDLTFSILAGMALCFATTL